MRRDARRLQALTLLWLVSWISYSMCQSPPGRPRLTRCRSPEKETFTCWWEPGSSGGLPASHRLYFRKENSMEVYECPDYHKAGNNSCYFDKRHTSIWIIYNITVVASNALGKTYSESVEVDVMDIVQPHPPENINMSVIQTDNSFYFLVQWKPPRDADTRSGWVTIKYEIRMKMENSREKNSSWEFYSAGKQLEFSIYSPQPGAFYLIQVRCKLDQGLWSEWSRAASIHTPDKTSDTQNAVMILAVTLTAFVFSLTAGVLAVKMKHVKLFLLPPVPEPKIKGLDIQLLKSGTSEEIFSALIIDGYPRIIPSSERQVEYLMVSDGVEVSDDKTEENSSTEPAKPQNVPPNNKQKRLSCPDPRRDSQDYSVERETTLTTGNISKQQSFSGTIGETRAQLHNDSSDLTIKSQNQNTSNTQLKLSSTTGYVEVDKEKQDQEAIVAEDYSKISDIICDHFLVLRKDSVPVKKHKEEKNGDAIEPFGYLETVTNPSSGS